MTEYIITCDDEVASWVGNDVESMQPLVRCRDCRHYHDGVCYRPDGDGDYARWAVEPGGYCAWGERKEGAR